MVNASSDRNTGDQIMSNSQDLIIRGVFVPEHQHITYDDACLLEAALISHRNTINEARRIYPDAATNEDREAVSKRIASVHMKLLSIIDGPRDRAIANATIQPVSYTGTMKKRPIVSRLHGYQGLPSWFLNIAKPESHGELHQSIFERLKGGEVISDHQRIYRTYDEAFADADKAYIEAVISGEFNPVS